MFVSSRGPRYTEQEARAAIAAAYCWTDALRRLEMCGTGGGYLVLKRYAEKWGIPTDHFDPHEGRRRAAKRRRQPVERILVEGSTFDRGALKRRLYSEGLKRPVCELCGQGELWRGRRMALILDHINGVRDDNRLENLRIVCPNCAATLTTHCGRNVPPARTCEQCGKRYTTRERVQRFCSRSCAKQGAGLGVARPSQRKVERPPLAELLASIEREGYRATGRRYGVSDNAVRKWLRFYERERERRCAEPERAGAGGGSRG